MSGSVTAKQKQESGLRLDSREAFLEGGERGALIDEDVPEESLLVEALSYDLDDLQMPPSERLADESIKQFIKWIEMGMPWPEEKDSVEKFEKNNSAGHHWSFQPIANPVSPKTEDDDWSLNDIDRFVLASLRKRGLRRSASASPRQLIRRLYYDLHGLPPTFQELQSHVRDFSPGKYAKLIDELLVNKRYGEHWGRHWLDVARYADTKGYTDGGIPQFAFAYTYRDYVIRALNEDLPYNEFLMDQLAADTSNYAEEARWRLAGDGVFDGWPPIQFQSTRHDR